MWRQATRSCNSISCSKVMIKAPSRRRRDSWSATLWNFGGNDSNPSGVLSERRLGHGLWTYWNRMWGIHIGKLYDGKWHKTTSFRYGLIYCLITHILFWFVGFVCRQRLCINFSVSRVNFLTTLHSHLNIFCYFWSSLFNVDVNCSYIFAT